MRSSMIGLFFGVFIIYYAVVNTGDNSAIYMNYLSWVIVFGGSFSVAIITYGLKSTAYIFSLFFKAFSTSKYTNSQAAQEVIQISKDIYFGKKSINQLMDSEIHPFIKDGLRLIQNKVEHEKLKRILQTMLNKRNEHLGKEIDQLQGLAKYPPAFGMMGTVIGLIDVLNKMNTADSMTSIGPSMAVALITTLYGIFLSNYIIQPISDNLLSRSQADLKIREIIAEGLLLIGQNENPVFVREILLGHLMPAAREKYLKQHNTNIKEAA